MSIRLKYLFTILCAVMVLTSCVKDESLFAPDGIDGDKKTSASHEVSEADDSDPTMFGGDEPTGDGEGEGDDDGITDDDDEEDDDDGSGITDDDDDDDDDDDNSRRIGG